MTSNSILQKFIQSQRGPWSIFRVIKTHLRFSSVHTKKPFFDPEFTRNSLKVSISKMYNGFYSQRKSHLQASIIIPNFAPIATSHSSATKMAMTHLRKDLKKQHSNTKREKREGHTVEDGWSRRQSKSNLSWDTQFWGPREGPSSQQLLCSYLLLFLSPPSLSFFLSFSLSLTTNLFCSHTFFHFTVSVSTSTVWSSLFFVALFFHSLGYVSVSAFCLSETRLLWEGKEGEREVSCHEKLWGQLLRERGKRRSMRGGRGRKKRGTGLLFAWLKIHGFTLCFFVCL